MVQQLGANASSDEHLERSLQLATAGALQMRKTLESPQGKLLLAIQQVSTMLTELSTDKLPPRSYYEIYNVCFDALSQLQEYLLEDHRNHHLADVYEIVEYTGSVLPRLYLMITVGSAFMASGDAPKQEVLKDMLEMSRGIQNPLRGLFLRFYLGQRTGGCLASSTKAELQFSVAFTLTNFVEMNKLWVRYQHQGHSRNYDQRTKERIQLQTVIGSSILRLSQLDAVDIGVFKDQILPAVLDQVIECRDKLAQEYLLDVMVQAFPVEFHLETLNMFLECIEYLTPDTAASAILLASMNRTVDYARAKAQEAEAQEAAESEAKAQKIKAQEIKAQEAESEAAESKTAESKPKESEPTQVQQATEKLSLAQEDQQGQPAHEESREGELEEEKATQDAAQDGDSSKPGPEAGEGKQVSEQTGEQPDEQPKLEEDEGAKTETEASEGADPSEGADTKSVKENGSGEAASSNGETKTNEAEASKDTSEPETSSMSDKALTPSQAVAVFFRDAIERYWDTIQRLKADERERAKLIKALLEISKASNNTLPLSALFKLISTDKFQQSKELESLLLTLFALDISLETIMELFKEFPSLLSSQTKATRHAIAEKIINQILQSSASVSSVSQTRQVLELFLTLLRSGGFDAAKVAQFVRLIRADSVQSTLELLELAHKTMREGGQRVVQQTTSVIVSAALLLLLESPDASNVGHILKFVNRACHDLATVGDSPLEAYRLHIAGARAADSAGAEEAAYEFFAQALAIYEESISESYQQVAALAIVIQALQQTTVFTSESYVPLAQRCYQYSQRLLKKPDQCRSLLLAAHLYWDNDYSDSRAVEETLNRALRSADSVMDVQTSVDLFLDVLETNLYFLANDAMTVTVQRVNSLLKLINENINTAKSNGAEEPETKVTIAELEARFGRIKRFIKSQIQSFPSFVEIEI